MSSARGHGLSLSGSSTHGGPKTRRNAGERRPLREVLVGAIAASNPTPRCPDHPRLDRERDQPWNHWRWVGPSTNSVLHLLAIARTGGVPLCNDDFETIRSGCPVICDLSPAAAFVDGWISTTPAGIPRDEAAARCRPAARRLPTNRSKTWPNCSLLCPVPPRGPGGNQGPCPDPL